MCGISYALLIKGERASANLLAAIQQIEIEDHANMADMLRLRIAIGVKDGCAGWTLIDSDLFSPLAAIRVMLAVGDGPAEPLIDGSVIETNADFSNQPGQSLLNVVAMDPTVRMNLKEKVREWPDMADSTIAETIFREYGFAADIEQTQPSRQEVDHKTIQRGTDIQFLRHLAGRNGYECYVETDPQGGPPVAHFHRPRLEQSAQGVLSVNMGEGTNVNQINARYDMLRPTTTRVTGLDIGTRSDQPAQAEDLAQRRLGSMPALNGDHRRQVLLSRAGLTQTGELQTYAQAVADRSAWAITADGELNTVAYGRVLRAKRPVEVRGAGSQFSGTYYVERVLHTLRGDEYTQRFTLRRNALGLMGERFVQNQALSS